MRHTLSVFNESWKCSQMLHKSMLKGFMMHPFLLFLLSPLLLHHLESPAWSLSSPSQNLAPSLKAGHNRLRPRRLLPPSFNFQSLAFPARLLPQSLAFGCLFTPLPSSASVSFKHQPTSAIRCNVQMRNVGLTSIYSKPHHQLQTVECPMSSCCPTDHTPAPGTSRNSH